jgi:hypothetical protein
MVYESEKGSLHRHQYGSGLLKQELTEGSLRQNRLDSTDSDWLKAAGRHARLVLKSNRTTAARDWGTKVKQQSEQAAQRGC